MLVRFVFHHPFELGGLPHTFPRAGEWLLRRTPAKKAEIHFFHNLSLHCKMCVGTITARLYYLNSFLLTACLIAVPISRKHSLCRIPPLCPHRSCPPAPTHLSCQFRRRIPFDPQTPVPVGFSKGCNLQMSNPMQR